MKFRLKTLILLVAALSGWAGADEAPWLSWSQVQADPGVRLRRAEMGGADFGLDAQMTLSVYLPPQYDGHHQYPVLYVVDGQNIFDGKGGTWQLDETLQAACGRGEMEPVIAVAIHTPWGIPKRKLFMTPRASVDPENPNQNEWEGGQANRLLGFTLQAKKVIDHDFVTDSHDTCIMGSSLGGMFALYAGFRRPDVFTRVAALSPSLFLVDRPKQSGSETWIPAHQPWPKVVWLDMGDREEPEDPMFHLNNAKKLDHWFHGQSEFPNARYQFVPYEGAAYGQHNEDSWALRIKQMLPWMYRVGSGSQ